MRRPFPIALLAVLAVCSAASAQNSPSPDSTANAPAPEKVKVYKPGKEASFPERLPIDLSSIITDKCERATSGETVLSFIVDATGSPHNVMFVHPTGDDIDRMALLLARANRFKPGTLNGTTPVAVGLSETIKLKVCASEITTQADRNPIGYAFTHSRNKK